MGYTQQETNALIKNSMVLSKVGQIESAEATQYLVSAMKGFDIEAKNSIDIVDKLSAVDLVSATSAGGLATAMSRTAESAKLAGVSINNTIGYIAAVAEVTQKSEESIGESFKTIFARLENVKAGVDVDEEGKSLNDVEKVLTRFGIALRDSQYEFRNMGDVLNDINSKWKDFTSVEQAQIATAIAGTRQRENFLVLMENYGTALKYAGVAADSSGTALEKFAAYEESVEAKMNTLTSTWEGMVNSLFSGKTMGAIVDLGTNLLKLADFLNIIQVALIGLGTKAVFGVISSFSKLGDSSSRLRIIWSQLTNVESLLKNKLVSIQPILVNGSKQFQVINKATGEVIVTTQTYADANLQAANASKTLASQQDITNAKMAVAGNVISMAMSAVALAVGIGISIWQKYKQKQSEARQETIQATQDYIDLSKSIAEWTTSLEKANEALSKAAISSGEYNQAQQSILNIKDQVVQAYKDKTDAAYDYGDSIQHNIDKLEEYELKEWQSKNRGEYDKAQKWFESRAFSSQDDIRNAEAIVSLATEAGIEGIGQIEDIVNYTKREQYHLIQQINDALYEQYKAGKLSTDEFNKQSKILNSINTTYFGSDKAKEYMQILQEGAPIVAKLESESKEYYKELIGYQNEYNKAVEKGDTEAQEAAIKKLSDWIEKNKDNIEALSDLDVKEYFQNIIDSLSGLTARVKIKTDLQETDSETKQILETYSKGGSVDLTLRPMIDAKYLKEAGWENVDDKIATIYAQYYGEEGAYFNFTPILTDENGNYKGVLTPEELQDYAEKVIAGVHSDYLNLQIGTSFTTPKENPLATEEWERTKNLYIKKADEIRTSFYELEGINPDIKGILGIEEAIQQIEKGAQEIPEDYKESFAILQKYADEYGVSVSDLVQILQDYNIIAKSSADITRDSKDAYNSTKTEIDKLVSTFQTVDSAQQEYSENQGISVSTLNSLLELDDEYLALLINEEGQLELNSEAFAVLAKKKLEQARIDLITQFNNEINKMEEEGKTVADLTAQMAGLAAAKEVAMTTTMTVNGQEENIESTDFYKTWKAKVDAYTLAINSSFVPLNRKGSKSKSSSSQKDAWLEKYKSEVKEVEHLHNMDKLTTQEYYNALAKLRKKYLAGNKKYHEEEESALEKEWKLRKQILEEQKGDYEATVKYVEAVVDKRKQALDDEIDKLEKKKKAIEDANKAKEDELQLQKLEENLAKARQRSIRVYYENVGWVWTQDKQAIEEAQKELDDYNSQKAIDEIDKQIDAIQDQIDKWDDWLKKWQDIPKEFENGQNAITAASVLGANAEKDILNQRQATLDNFKKNYLKTLQDIANAQKGIGSPTVSTKTGTSGSGSGNGGGGGGGGGSWTKITTTPKAPTTTPKAPTTTPKIGYTMYSKGKTTKDTKLKNLKSVKVSGLDYYLDTQTGLYWSAEAFKKSPKNGEGTVIKGTTPLVQTINGVQQLKSTTTTTIKLTTTIRLTTTIKLINTKTFASGTPFASGGLTNINENGNELVVRNPARGSYTYLQHGDGVLNAGLTRRIMDFATNPTMAVGEVLSKMLKTPKDKDTVSKVINIGTINLPSVNNANQFIKELQLITKNR